MSTMHEYLSLLLAVLLISTASEAKSIRNFRSNQDIEWLVDMRAEYPLGIFCHSLTVVLHNHNDVQSRGFPPNDISNADEVQSNARDSQKQNNDFYADNIWVSEHLPSDDIGNRISRHYHIGKRYKITVPIQSLPAPSFKPFFSSITGQMVVNRLGLFCKREAGDKSLVQLALSQPFTYDQFDDYRQYSPSSSKRVRFRATVRDISPVSMSDDLVWKCPLSGRYATANPILVNNKLIYEAEFLHQLFTKKNNDTENEDAQIWRIFKGRSGNQQIVPWEIKGFYGETIENVEPVDRQLALEWAVYLNNDLQSDRVLAQFKLNQYQEQNDREIFDVNLYTELINADALKPRKRWSIMEFQNIQVSPDELEHRLRETFGDEWRRLNLDIERLSGQSALKRSLLTSSVLQIIRSISCRLFEWLGTNSRGFRGMISSFFNDNKGQQQKCNGVSRAIISMLTAPAVSDASCKQLQIFAKYSLHCAVPIYVVVYGILKAQIMFKLRLQKQRQDQMIDEVAGRIRKEEAKRILMETLRSYYYCKK